MNSISPLVTIIVPVYNVKQYLPQCLDSILSQTYTNLECIIVDDGSTDGSSELADVIAAQDVRVTVIHKENGGLSDARNAGLALAHGYYIMFVDSDDYLRDASVLSELITLFQNSNDDYDFINFNCVYYFQKNNSFRPWSNYSSGVTDAANKGNKIIALVSHAQFPMSACLKIIKRDFLINNSIQFIKGIISEDIPWFLEIVRKSNNFLFINEYYYIYRKQVTNSISSTFSKKNFSDLCWIIETETKK
ncbi:MAG: hypothetical protein Ta2B_17570 [Termitinemataceae bacterium]|nr:MAG: hypothetical protein Ta2B_17570 [Termitinemataceae bacterium]